MGLARVEDKSNRPSGIITITLKYRLKKDSV